MSETTEPNELTPVDPIPSAEEGKHTAADDGMAAAEQPVQPEASAEEIPVGADDAVDVLQEENPEADEEAEPYTDEQTAELRNVVESLIFASDEPIPAKLIRQLIEEVNKDRVEANRIRATTEGIKRAVAAINRTYDDRAFHIIQIAGGFAFATKPKFSAFVGKLAKEKARRKLSATAIETLAIIAYKQPITKSEIEFIRGVNADYIIKTLLEKNLITITGRASTPGRPLLYGTTDEFLKHFGLHEISDLPKPREIEELIGETELEVEKRLLAEQQELEFKDELAQKMDGGQKAKSSGPRPPLRQHTGKKPDAPITAPQADMPPSSETPVPDAAAQPPAGEQETPETVSAETTAAVESVAVDEHAAEVPAPVDDLTAEEAPIEPTVIEEPVADEQVEEELVAEEPAAEEPVRDIPVVEDEVRADEASDGQPAAVYPIYMPAADHTPESVEEPAESHDIDAAEIEAQAEEIVLEEPEVDETTVDEQAVETAIVEEPTAQETHTIEEPFVEETPAIEEPVAVDMPAIEEPVVEETPAIEEPLAEETQSIEEPVAEETHTIEEAAAEEAAAVIEEQSESMHEISEPPVETMAEETESDAASAAMQAGEEEHAITNDESHAPEKGWSKWKTKIKTFFKKLFV